MPAPTVCPQCASSAILHREKRGDWLCGKCDHTWAGEAPGAADAASESAAPAPLGVAVFISYGHADASALVRHLKADLEAEGCKPVWLDAEMIAGGERWTARIEAGIRGSQALLAVMTPHALREASICQDEVALAIAEGKLVVPLRINADPLLRPSLLLVRRSRVDFTGDYEPAFARLLRALAGDESALEHPLQSVAGQRPLAFDLEIARLSPGFTGRVWLLRRLDAWLQNERGRAFVIEGEPGIGKSAIAARLAARPDCAAVHFCTSRDADSLKPLAFIANLVVALSARVEGFAARVEARHPEELRENDVTAFRQLVVEPAHALTDVPARPQLIVVDALDEAVSREGESIVDLIAAHAASLPPWLRLVATTRPEAGIVARLAVFDPFTLDASSADNLTDVAAFIEARLLEPELAGRLDDPQAAAQTLSALAASNFLYAQQVLAALAAGTLDEGDFTALPPALAGLYHEMFRRAWPDLDVYRREAAPILRCLAAAFAPLPWEVLRAATGLDVETLNARLNALSPYLREDGSGRDACLSPYHRSLADWLAISGRGQLYAVDAAAGHEMLAAALGTDPLASDFAISCLPRHLVALGRWPELAARLADLAFLDAAWERDQHEVLRLWASLESEGYSAPDVYATVLEAPERVGIDLLEPLPRLLRVHGHPRDAEALRAHMVERLREADDPVKLQDSLNKLANLRKTLGDLGGAYALLLEAEAICVEFDDPVGLQATMNNRALILIRRGRLEEAAALLAETEGICRRLGLGDRLESSIFNQATIRRRLGEMERAAQLLDEAEQLARDCANPAKLRNVFGAQAVIARLRGDLRSALALRTEQERMCREVAAKSATAEVLSSTAQCLMDREDYGGAAARLREARAICDRLGLPTIDETLLGARARLAHETGALAEALELLEERQTISRALHRQAGLLGTLIGMAEVLVDAGRPEEAMSRLDQAHVLLGIVRQPEMTLRFHAARVEALRLLGDVEAALAECGSFERLCRDLGAARYLGIALEQKARLLMGGEEDAAALSAAREALQLAESLPAPKCAARRAALMEAIARADEAE